jgi:hypothetical protein
MDEDWDVLVSLFPAGWRESARETNALKGLRKHKSEEDLLRTLLIHLATGCSLRETVVRAREAHLAEMSDVALLKRLRKCKNWLARLCQSMFEDRGIHVKSKNGLEIRLLDATTVKEPGKTGSLWRIHYSLRLPSLRCDFFKVTPTKGEGNGEALSQFSLNPEDYVIADRAYGVAKGIECAHEHQAALLVRISPHHIDILDSAGQSFSWQERLAENPKAGHIVSWDVLIPTPKGLRIPGRVCAIRKTEQAIRSAHKRIRERAIKKQNVPKPETFLYAEYIIVLTTFDKSQFSSSEVLHWYRLRWQIEIVFKRFKQLAQLGHLPKYTDESSKAWLYGKLFVALMTEKLIWQAHTISPWGYVLDKFGER